MRDLPFLTPNPAATRWPSCALAIGILFAGCAAPPIEPSSLTAESGAAQFAARSLRDPKLLGFLQSNLGHVPETWDFEALCWVGFYYHPSLDLARAQWQIARAAEVTASARPNPTLTLSPGYNFTREAGVSPWMPAVSMDWLLQRSAIRTHTGAAATAEVEAARFGIVTAAWQLRSELRKALIAARVSDRKLGLLRHQAELQAQLLSRLEQQFAAGGLSAVEVSTSRSALLRAQAAAADAEAQAATARIRVAAALGLSASALDGINLPEVQAPAELSAAELSSARQQSLQSRADVLAALAKYRSLQAALDLEVAKRFPDIHLGPGYQWDQGANKWSLGLTFELPVFHRNEGPIAQAVAKRAEAVAQFNSVQAQAVAAIDAAAATFRAATTQRERTRGLRTEIERQVSLVRQRQEAGAADQIEAQTAQLDLIGNESALLDAETTIALAAGDLEDALQVPFPNLAALTAPSRDSHSRPL